MNARGSRKSKHSRAPPPPYDEYTDDKYTDGLYLNYKYTDDLIEVSTH